MSRGKCCSRNWARPLRLTDNGGGNLFVDDGAPIFERVSDQFGTAGVTKGYNPPTKDEFCPIDVVTRGQMASVQPSSVAIKHIIDSTDGKLIQRVRPRHHRQNHTNPKRKTHYLSRPASSETRAIQVSPLHARVGEGTRRHIVSSSLAALPWGHLAGFAHIADELIDVLGGSSV